MCAFWGRVAPGNLIATIDGKRMHMLEDTAVRREWAQEFGIVRRRAITVASAMVDNATNEGAPFAYADKRPQLPATTTAMASAMAAPAQSARGDGALGWRQKAGPIMQQKDAL